MHENQGQGPDVRRQMRGVYARDYGVEADCLAAGRGQIGARAGHMAFRRLGCAVYEVLRPA